jgi:hypothetical protein
MSPSTYYICVFAISVWAHPLIIYAYSLLTYGPIYSIYIYVFASNVWAHLLILYTYPLLTYGPNQ